MPSPIHLTSALLAIAVTAILAWYALRRRTVPGAVSFAWLMAAYTEWSVTYTLSLGTNDLIARLVWAKIGYLGSASLALAWIIFAIQYTGFDPHLTCKRWWPLGILPAVTVVLVFTNELHHLVWRFAWLDVILRVEHGPWYWVFVAYSCVLFVTGMILLVRMFARSVGAYRWQSAAIIAGGVITWAWILGYLLLPSDSSIPEYTPLMISLSGVSFAWGLFRFRLLDITPVAREVVVDSMSDGMLVLDRKGRIIDLNPAAQGILDCSAAHCIGLPITQVIPSWPGTLARFDPHQSIRVEISMRQGSQARFYDLRASFLPGNTPGQLVLLTDVTDRRRIETAEREQRTLAEALRDTAAALNSTLQLDEVLDRILLNIGKVAPYDGVNIMLLKEGETRVVRHQGYVERGLQQQLEEQRMVAREIANLREMIETGQPVLISDTHMFPGWVVRPESVWVRSNLGAPICRRGETIGFLLLDSSSPDFFTPVHAEQLLAFADQAAIAMENARLYTEVNQMAQTDALTGVNNRRAFMEAGRREVEIALRLSRPLSMLMLDIDHFKQVNDTFGHPAGDQVLKALVTYIRESVRSIDVIGRYGGEEFVVLLIESDIHAAQRIAERVRREIARALMLTDRGAINITVSIGAAALTPAASTLEALIECSDQALYAAKQYGRNRVAA